MTETAEHTPGPWTVEPLQWDHGASIAIVADNGAIICTIAPRNEDDEPDMSNAVRGPHDEANARLIATAPKMESFIATIARMTQDGETREGDAEPFIMENDDAVSTLNQLIEHAREILKPTE
jgi:hypothetical protein